MMTNTNPAYYAALTAYRSRVEYEYRHGFTCSDDVDLSAFREGWTDGLKDDGEGFETDSDYGAGYRAAMASRG